VAFSRRPVVFLTAVTHDRRPLLACRETFEILVDIWSRSAAVDDWFVGRFVLMPDHVHLFACSGVAAKPLGGWVPTWKLLSSRRIAFALKTAGPIWQKDYFDRYLRSADNYQGKWQYVEMNPVRRGLCTQPAEWPWKGELFELRY
jgi:REP element-mobilizing transposase RayT